MRLENSNKSANWSCVGERERETDKKSGLTPKQQTDRQTDREGERRGEERREDTGKELLEAEHKDEGDMSENMCYRSQINNISNNWQLEICKESIDLENLLRNLQKAEWKELENTEQFHSLDGSLNVDVCPGYPPCFGDLRSCEL